MQIDIAAHIEKLLFLHDTLIIPAFGGFTAMRIPAAVDYAGGAVTPPSKTLTFNENLAFDDGVLVSEIAKDANISVDAAQEAVGQFVEKMQAQLNQREIVTLPGVGRLYKNYVQKIQFLPDSTNFHAGSYGLPPLQFSPIARSREVAPSPPAVSQANGSAAGAAAVTAIPEPAKSAATNAIPPLPPPPSFVNDPYTPPKSSSAQIGTGVGIGLLLCAVAFGIWWWQHKKSQNASEQQARNILKDMEEEPVATAPLPGVGGITKLAEKEEKNRAAAENKPVEKEEEDLGDEVDEAAAQKVDIIRRQNEAPPSATPATKAGARQCILIIATLQDQNNADRLVAKLKGAGYDVYQRSQRGRQIGVQFEYTDPKEVDAKRAELIQFTGEKGVFVKKK